jgi:catecholate siderophore receptor
MRLFTWLGIGCALGCAPTAAHAVLPALPHAAPSDSVPGDTTTRIRFNIPAQTLTSALGAYSRQATLDVQVDRKAAATLRSAPVSGTYTAAEALRELLAGTGLTARFVDRGTALVTAGGSVYTLSAITVNATRSRGYGTPRTSTATRTETPLRDVPQSVSIVTRELIADQSMQGMADVVRYVPGITMGQGEGHRDAPTIRGNSSTADFFVDGVRDDAQYLRDLYNVERVEALKGSNAMIFGRGGGGGVLNRVTKEAQWAPTRTLSAEGGSFDHKRGTVDVGQGFGTRVAARLNGMYENSGSFRERYELSRYGINPTVALAAGERTTLRAGYEFFNDERTVDRGIPSFAGRPSSAGIATFFGDPKVNHGTLRLHAATALVEHSLGAGATLRNRVRFADYEKFYQNSYPGGALNAAGTSVSLAAYNHGSSRRNLFNQTDLAFAVETGPVRHTLLVGAEVGRQESDQIRNTGYFNNTATSFAVAFDNPSVVAPITFRQSATDADNSTVATVAAVYLQNQVELSRHLQAIVGVRYDRFNVDFHDRRTGAGLDRADELVSPRAGLVLKPVAPLSFYGSYSVSYLPSSGDQFASLTATTATLEPERFTNRELGAKWDVRSNFALAGALFRLDRTNTTAPDPADPSRTLQTGSQRTTGWELNASGSVTEGWQMVAGFSSQRARITSTTAAAKEGQEVALVPHHTFSLWNRYQLHRALGVGVGIVRQSDMFAAIDNTVTLPGFTRADGALFVRLNSLVNAQVNVENLFDERYYATSHGNNNIMPGATRSLRVSLNMRR